jgi:hypothetical protein
VTTASAAKLSVMSPVVPLERDAIASALSDSVAQSAWRDRLLAMCGHDAPGALHIAVMHEPFLSLLLTGHKTIESRFSVNRVCPFQSVAVGDILAIKAQSGPILGLALVEHAAFYELDPATWKDLRNKFSGPLCAEDDSFWHQRARARYGSLLRVAEPVRTHALKINKRDRRGWVRLENAYLQGALPV